MTETSTPVDYVLRASDLSFFYGKKQALFNVTMNIPDKKVTALIGPSGCGKSTFLRCVNRMNDLIDGVETVGSLMFHDVEINDKNVDVIDLRRKIGMVFQKSNPFPKSIFENIVYGLRIQGFKDKEFLANACQKSLARAGLWNEVKDRLNESALGLSGGQMQRLCIARTIAVSPAIILMDEPCSALDPKSTAIIEDLIAELSDEYSILIVTHSMQQASRVSDFTSFFYEGQLIEFGKTEALFTAPKNKQTEDYITGRFG
jgi:phosphate transport system ATP-binding protein